MENEAFHKDTTIASSIFILFLKSDIGMQILAEEINILKKNRQA